MKIETTNKLMKAGLTDEQFEIVNNYINELLLHKEDIQNSSVSLKQSLGRCERVGESYDKFRRENKKGDVFILDESSSFLKSGGFGKSSLAFQYMKLYKALYGIYPSVKVLDYNKFIEENSDLQTVNNFKKFVGRIVGKDIKGENKNE